MQISARYKAVYELMEAIFKDKQPADNIINNYFRERRYIGSGDRRFISEKIWNIIRRRSRLAFEAGEHDLRKMLLVFLQNENLDEVFSDGPYSLPRLTNDEKNWLKNLSEEPYPNYIEAECPKWIYDKINDLELLKSLNTPATADFRINTANRDIIIDQLSSEGFEVQKTPYSPIGLRAQNRINLNNCTAYQDGLIEVQDEASQIVSILCDVKAGDKVIDYCCGAGGKSLAIAYLLKGQGEIMAHDIDLARLEQLRPRMKRLGITNIKFVDSKEIGEDFDCFIVDAPCSGSGTWRRSPDAKYRLTPEKIVKLNQTQKEILETAFTKVKQGGKIVYITCSIFAQENGQMIESFIKEHSNLHCLNLKELWQKKIFTPYIGQDERFLHFSPLSTSTDGFFISILQKD